MITRIEKALAERRLAIKEGDKGFTLIELLVVVIIIGILAAIAIPIYIGVQNNAKDSAVKTDVSSAKTAVVANYTSQGSYVAAADLGTALSSDGYTAPGDANYGTDGVKPAITYVANDGGFCIQATSVTGKTFAASDTTGVAEGTCSAAGIWTAPAAP